MILIELYNGRIVYGGGSLRSLRASEREQKRKRETEREKKRGEREREPKGEVSLQSSSKDTIKIYLGVQSGLIKSRSGALRTLH